jgi:hypothetical protein
MSITPWLSSPVTLSIPGTTAFEYLPLFVNLNGEFLFAVDYVTSYQGEVAQPYTVYGFSFDPFGDNLGGGAVSSVNATNPSTVPGSSYAAFGSFGGAYFYEFAAFWLSTSSNSGSPATFYYDIFSQDSQGNVNGATAVALSSNLTIPAVPAGDPSLTWPHVQATSIGNGNAAAAVDTVNASNIEQLDFAIVNGSGTGTPITFSYSDPNKKHPGWLTRPED